MEERPPRLPRIIANWKMHKSPHEAMLFLKSFLPAVQPYLSPEEDEGVDIDICPHYLALSTVAEACRDTNIAVGAQNMHEAEEGAFTGEVSAWMLKEAGADLVILGHSERRRHFCETDEALARKVTAALEADILPILCVGETEAERDAGETEAVLRRQVETDLALMDPGYAVAIVIAYEPVWAIGTGRTATSEQAQEAIGFIRAVLAERSGERAQVTPIVYGGSVKPDNAAELIAQPDVDGFLVGGASLDPTDFLAIVAAAAQSR